MTPLLTVKDNEDVLRDDLPLAAHQSVDGDSHDDPEKGATLGGIGGAIVGGLAGSTTGPVGAVIGAVTGAAAGSALSGAAVAAIDRLDHPHPVPGMDEEKDLDLESSDLHKDTNYGEDKSPAPGPDTNEVVQRNVTIPPQGADIPILSVKSDFP